MRYKLSADFELCGFKNLPFAVMDKRNMNYRFFRREEWMTFQRAAYGLRFAEGEPASEEQRALLAELAETGVIIPAGEEEKVPVPPYRKYENRYRESVQWSITGRCNARCRHCFMSAPEAKMGEPSLEQCLEIIKMLDGCGVRKVAVTGGEPFVRSDFWQIIDAMREHHLVLTMLYSNGILVDQKLIDGLKSRGMHPAWQISFDGTDGWHDWMRGISGATDLALNAIRLLRANGFSVSCATSVFRDNLKCIPDTMKLLGSLGVSGVKTGCMQQQGEWLKYPEQWLTPEEELQFYLEYLPEYVRSGRPVTLQCEGLFMGYSDAFLHSGLKKALEKCEKCRAHGSCYELGTGDENGNGNCKTWDIPMERVCPEDREFTYGACEVVQKHFYIGAAGAVLPCMSLEGTPAGEAFPNLFRQPLSEILTDSYYTRMADASIGDVNQHDPECKTCEHRLVCRAGCRAAAVGADGADYLARDRRTCLMVKEDWPGKLRTAIENAIKQTPPAAPEEE